MESWPATFRKRRARLTQGKRLREKAIRLYKSGSIPFCVERVPGLFVVEGIDGHFTKCAPKASEVKACDLRAVRVAYLSRITDEEAADAILADAASGFVPDNGDIPF